MTFQGEGQLGWFFWRAAAEYSDKTALIDISQDEPRKYSFRGLDDAMNRVASMLQNTGLKTGDRVGLAISNRAEFLMTMFGAMRAGLVPVPINLKQSKEVLAYILADSGAKAAIIEPAAGAHITCTRA